MGKCILNMCGVLLVSLSVFGQPVLNDSVPFPAPSIRVDSGLVNTSPPQTSQTGKPFEVGEIEIKGNTKTKDYIILRELPFKSGDSVNLAQLVSGFEVSKQQLMNTRLFNEVVIALKNFHGHFVNIQIEVKERWYIFPLPYLKPVDRNLAEWAKQGYAADRINYGFKFTYYNFTGRNDKLRIWLTTGYARQIQFQYDQPYADKSLKNGYKIGFNYGLSREINYATSHNQQVFNDSLSTTRLNGFVEYDYRPGLRTFHAFRLGYSSQTIDEHVLELNPKYFNTNQTTIRYPEFMYSLSHFNVDYIPYPLNGWMGEASLIKRGINKETNMWQLAGKLTRAWALGHKFSYAFQAMGGLRVPFDQPYVNSQMFGYGELYLRGLEKYVIDGVGSFLVRNTIRKQLFKFNVSPPIRSRSHDKIPFIFYAKAYGDYGYAYNKVFPDNSLVNKNLYSGGLGIDVLTFYDVVLRFDYSFNQLGENGLFLHIKNDF
ncbi:MAG TPA: POTRA domain-containing protein [Flavitalea sp.]|nr:POTRA domain-containing protein [Flavitalea sp.]